MICFTVCSSLIDWLTCLFMPTLLQGANYQLLQWWYAAWQILLHFQKAPKYQFASLKEEFSTILQTLQMSTCILIRWVMEILSFLINFSFIHKFTISILRVWFEAEQGSSGSLKDIKIFMFWYIITKLTGTSYTTDIHSDQP